MRKLLWAGVAFLAAGILAMAAFAIRIPGQKQLVAEKPVGDFTAEVSRPALSTGADGCVNVNTAGFEELTELPGISDSTARNILEEREANGRFWFPEDLLAVKGIGEKTLAKIRSGICFD